MSDLTIEEWMFVALVTANGNAAQAYRDSHPNYTGKRASELAFQLGKRAHIKAAIREATEKAKQAMELSREMVRTDIINVLSADPRELFNVQQGACRHCHGVDHQWQRTKGEFERDRHQAEMKQESFDPKGGIGYDAYADPHPDCPECNGQGEQRIKLTDTRLLSTETAALLQSIEQTKNGIKITTRSKDAAREAAARLLGMNKDTVKVTTTYETATDSDLQARLTALREDVGGE